MQKIFLAEMFTKSEARLSLFAFFPPLLFFRWKKDKGKRIIQDFPCRFLPKKKEKLHLLLPLLLF